MGGATNMKTVNIDRCPQCRFYIFDDNEIVERWGLHWCLKEDRECLEQTIPKWCPLEDAPEDE